MKSRIPVPRISSAISPPILFPQLAANTVLSVGFRAAGCRGIGEGGQREAIPGDRAAQQLDQRGLLVVGEVERHLPTGARPLIAPLRFELRLAPGGSNSGSGMSNLRAFHGSPNSVKCCPRCCPGPLKASGGQTIW
jgi:hypothetical protein